MLSRYERLSSAISEISRLINRISAEVMKDYGLKGAWAKYLLVMHRHKTGITAARLCLLCERNKSDVSRALAELEELGLIMKLSGNRYRAKLILTERGSEIATGIARRAMDVITFVGKDISEDEREIFYHSLDSISQNLATIEDGSLSAISPSDNT